MTDADDPTLRPVWRRADRADEPEPVPVAAVPAVSDDADADALDRGRTVALLAALGRMQMSLDVIAKQQQKSLESIESRLTRIERHLAGGGSPPA